MPSPSALQNTLYVFVPKFEEYSLEETQRTWDTGRRRVHQIERYLMRQATLIHHAGIKAHWTLEYGVPGAKIIETAHSHKVSMVVMTTQGRGGLVRWRLGGVSEEALHDGGPPVLLVPSAQAEPELAPEAQTRSAKEPTAMRW